MELSKNARMKLFQQTTGWSTDKMRANKKAVNDIVGDGNGGGPSNAITYDEQDLTEEQQAQARANIGAADAEALGGKKLWTGTAAEYAQLTPSNDTIYFITP